MYWIRSIEDGYPLFYCDSSADVAGLPTTTSEGDKSLARYDAWKQCVAGSHAFVCDSQDVYTLTTDDNWV